MTVVVFPQRDNLSHTLAMILHQLLSSILFFYRRIPAYICGCRKQFETVIHEAIRPAS